LSKETAPELDPRRCHARTHASIQHPVTEYCRWQAPAPDRQPSRNRSLTDNFIDL